MMVGQIFTKIGNFIENRQLFMLLNFNCAKLANFEDFWTCLGPFFFVDTVYIYWTNSLILHLTCEWRDVGSAMPANNVEEPPSVVLLHVTYHNSSLPNCIYVPHWIYRKLRSEFWGVWWQLPDLHSHYISVQVSGAGNCVVCYSWWLVKLINIRLQGRLQYCTVAMQVFCVHYSLLLVLCLHSFNIVGWASTELSGL